MARVGRFGRTPRSSPDLSGSIVAMIREYNAQRERNMVDAWTKGGKFEGKPVTDQMLLKYFTDKESKLDPADPLYDDAKNQVQQYGFAIRNSKQEVLYAQHKVNDAAMAAFYRREAAKNPVNSEIYRDLMKLSGQYTDRSKAATLRATGGSSADKAQARAALKARIETPSGGETAWDQFKNHLVDLARSYGILDSGQNPESPTATTGEGLGDLQSWQGDFGAFSDMVDRYAHDPAFAGDRALWTPYLKQFVPGFNGDYSLQGVINLRDSAQKGLVARLQDAQKNGSATQVKKIMDTLRVQNAQTSTLSQTDVMASYEQDRAIYEAVVGDPRASITDKWEATQIWKGQLTTIHSSLQQMSTAFGGPGQLGDGGVASVRAGRALCELDALGGNNNRSCMTLAEESKPNVAGVGGLKDGQRTGDAASTAAGVQATATAVNNLVAHPLDYVMAMVDANGKPTRDPAKGHMDVVLKTDLEAAGIPVMYVPSTATKTITGLDGKKITIPVITEARYGETLKTEPQGGLDITGRSTRDNFDPGQNRTDVGVRYTQDDGSFIYEYYDLQGKRHYTPASPFRGSDFTLDANGNVVPGGGGVYDPQHLEQGLKEVPDGKGNIIVSWVQDPNFTATAYDPYAVFDPSMRDPEAVAAMTTTVARSKTIAWAINQTYTSSLVLPSAQELKAALYLETGGNQQAYDDLSQDVIPWLDAERKRKDDEARGAFLQADQYMASAKASKDESTKGAFSTAGQYMENNVALTNQRSLQLAVSMGVESKSALAANPAQLAQYIKDMTGSAIRSITEPGYYGSDGVFHGTKDTYVPPPPNAYQAPAPMLVGDTRSEGRVTGPPPVRAPSPTAVTPRPTPGPAPAVAPTPGGAPPPALAAPPPPTSYGPSAPASGYAAPPPPPIYAPPPSQRDYNH